MLRSVSGSSVLITVAVLAVVGSGSFVEAQQRVGNPAASPGPQQRLLTSGSIEGTVTDEGGIPLEGAVISVLGASVTRAVTDATGRFRLDSLPPGDYSLRAHLPGYATSPRQLVEVGPSARRLHSFRLSKPNPGALVTAPDERAAVAAHPILAAGFGTVPDRAIQDPDSESDRSASTSDDDGSLGELAWRLRHIKRSVLKDTEHVAEVDPDPPVPIFGGLSGMAALGRAVESSARLAASLFSEFPFSGQFNLLTVGSFDSPAELLSADGMPRGAAYVSLGAPVGAYGRWSVHGAMTQGDVSSWIVAGSYVREAPSNHRLNVGLSYAAQRYDGGNAAALEAASDGTRNVSGIHAFDHWRVSRRVALDVGGRYARYGYLERSGLFSPRIGLVLSPMEHTSVRATVSQRMLAPGEDEFLPPQSAIWLPPERTFSPIGGGAAFRPERTRHLEISLERELGESYVVGLRRFYQGVDDQLVTLFGVQMPDRSRSDLGHYYVANTGAATVSGWGIFVSRSAASRVRGTVGYSATTANWTATSTDAVMVAMLAPSALRNGTERLHDLTTSVETDIPETSTRVFVIYRINTGFSRGDIGEASPGLDGRFEVQINQSLPFLGFSNTRWELLVAVRNLFRDSLDESSMYDELLVVRPPKRLVGGFLVRF